MTIDLFRIEDCEYLTKYALFVASVVASTRLRRR